MLRPAYLQLVLFLVWLSPADTFAQPKTVRLEVGKPVESRLKGGETHDYQVEMAAGQFLRITADQVEIGLVLRVISPDGIPLVEVDTPNSLYPERLIFVAETGGIHQIEVAPTSKQASPGKYRLKLEQLRAETRDDPRLAAAQRALREAGAIFSKKESDSPSAARVKIAQAIEQYELIETDVESKADGFFMVAKLFRSWGDQESSLTYYDRAIALFEQAGLKREAAVLLGGSALMAPSYIDYRLRYEKVRKISRELNDLQIEAGSLAQIMNSYYWVGDFSNALKTADESLKLAARTGYTRRLGMTYGTLGQIYLTLGNFSKAMEHSLKAVEIFQSQGGVGGVGQVILDIGLIYLAIGNDQLALEKFQAALDQTEKNNDPIAHAVSLGLIGEIYSRRGEYDKALEYFLKVEPILAVYNPNDRFRAYHDIAAVYRKTERYNEALEYMKKPLDNCQTTMRAGICTNLLVVVANIYLEKRDFAKALEYANQAVAFGKSLDYRAPLWAAFLTAAKAELGLGNGKEARRLLAESIAEVEIQRKNFLSDQDNSRRFFEDKSAPARIMIDLLVGDGKVSQAFSMAEQIKARTLLDILKTGSADYSKSLTVAEKETEARLKSEMVALNLRIANENDSAKLDVLRERLDKKRLEFEDFRVGIYATRPELKVQRGEISPLSLESATALLPDRRSVLLEFVVTEDRSFLFAIDKTGGAGASLKVYPIRIKQADLAQKIEKFRAGLASGDLDFTRRSQELYKLLFGSAQPQIDDKKHLIIVPDGPLWDLPFQALQDEQSRYFVEKSAISYAPSLTALNEMQRKTRTRQSAPDLELLAFGNPSIGADTSRKVSQVFMDEKLDPLPEAERLVKSLGKMYGAGKSTVMTGTEAREEIVKIEAPKYRIVQFATHGILNNTSPMYSHLVLSQKGDNPNEDGLLEAWEMKELSLTADLVILTACETARGKVSGGEGVIGMTWAMFVAGVPTTVASQWKVESSSTTELMLEFHRQLLSGRTITKAEALRRASLKLMNTQKYKHPSYWAGFVMVGDGS